MPSPQSYDPALPPNRCPRCAFRRERCLCDTLPRATPNIRLIVLQHIKDARKTTNTGRLLATIAPSTVVMRYGLPDLVLDLPALAAHPNSMVLFPKEESPVLTPSAFREDTPPTLFLLDGTWSQGARLAQRFVKTGVRPVQLPPGEPGAYRLRSSGDPMRICTIEAAARALSALGDQESADKLLHGFTLFVDRHLSQRAPRKP